MSVRTQPGCIAITVCWRVARRMAAQQRVQRRLAGAISVVAAADVARHAAEAGTHRDHRAGRGNAPTQRLDQPHRGQRIGEQDVSEGLGRDPSRPAARGRRRCLAETNSRSSGLPSSSSAAPSTAAASASVMSRVTMRRASPASAAEDVQRGVVPPPRGRQHAPPPAEVFAHQAQPQSARRADDQRRFPQAGHLQANPVTAWGT